MRKPKLILALATVLGFLLSAVLLATFAGELAPPEHVYSIDEVQTGLYLHPRAWFGRTVLVQAYGRDMRCADTTLTTISPNGQTRVTTSTTCPSPRVIDMLFPVAPQRSGLLISAPLSVTLGRGITAPTIVPPNALVVTLLHMPFIGRIVTLALVRHDPGAVYRVQILDPARCRSASCSQAILQ